MNCVNVEGGGLFYNFIISLCRVRIGSCIHNPMLCGDFACVVNCSMVEYQLSIINIRTQFEDHVVICKHLFRTQ